METLLEIKTTSKRSYWMLFLMVVMLMALMLYTDAVMRVDVKEYVEVSHYGGGINAQPVYPPSLMEVSPVVGEGGFLAQSGGGDSGGNGGGGVSGVNGGDSVVLPDDVVERAFNVSPFNGMAYGLLVVLLLVACYMIYRDKSNLEAEYRTAILQRDTEHKLEIIKTREALSATLQNLLLLLGNTDKELDRIITLLGTNQAMSQQTNEQIMKEVATAKEAIITSLTNLATMIRSSGGK